MISMNQFNQKCLTELESRIRSKDESPYENKWSEKDDKSFMHWFIEKAKSSVGLDERSAKDSFFIFMIKHAPL